jgi:biotin carboxyl carrier protein
MDMKKYVIKLNGKVYEVEMGELGSVAAVDVPNATQTPSQATPPTSAPASNGGEAVIAPMPGTILNVMVKAGDVVKKNQVLLVLEAMKMENEIVAPHDGTILSVTTSRGTVVNVSEELVRIG